MRAAGGSRTTALEAGGVAFFADQRRRSFFLMWSGQMVSVFGSGLTGFALAVWLYQRTGQATQYALVLCLSTLPEILISPFAGAFADRRDRRALMILSDSGAALTTLALAAMLFAERLELWLIYAAMVVRSICGAFQWPAYAASVPLLIPKAQLGRINGLEQFGRAGTQILAPLAGGILVAAIGLAGVLTIDVATFLFALFTLAWIRLPRPGPAISENGENATDGPSGEASFLADLSTGGRFLLDRPGLCHLLFYLGWINLLAGFNMALLPPLMLATGTSAQLGLVLATSSAGVLLGSLAQTAWGVPRRRVLGIVAFGSLYGLFYLMIGFGTSLPWIAGASFAAFFMVPQINGCSQVIWQTKVPPRLQGRVFALRRMVAQGSLPLAFLAAGPLADRVFEPFMAPSGALAGRLGPWFGVGPGRGIGLLYVLLGTVAVLVSLATLGATRLRSVEDELPDEID